MGVFCTNSPLLLFFHFVILLCYFVFLCYFYVPGLKVTTEAGKFFIVNDCLNSFIFNRIYNKILDRDWFSAGLFVS